MATPDARVDENPTAKPLVAPLVRPAVGVVGLVGAAVPVPAAPGKQVASAGAKRIALTFDDGYNSDDAVRREILSGVTSHLFRPPYGDIDSRVRPRSFAT